MAAWFERNVWIASPASETTMFAQRFYWVSRGALQQTMWGFFTVVEFLNYEVDKLRGFVVSAKMQGRLVIVEMLFPVGHFFKFSVLLRHWLSQVNASLLTDWFLWIISICPCYLLLLVTLSWLIPYNRGVKLISILGQREKSECS